MNLEIFNQIRKTINNPLIDSKLVENKHYIYTKYTSEHYYKYTIDLLETLCKKSKYENKKLLFHTTLNFLLKILYNSGNHPYFKNFDLLVLCVFSLGIKSTENQHKSPSLHKLKRIYPEKFSCYKNEDIKNGEILCIKLLEYNINILTSYECLFYLLKNKYNSLYLLESCIQELDNIIFEGAHKYVFKRPIDIAKESIEKAKFKENKKKNVNNNNDKKIYNSKGHYNINNNKISSKPKKALPNNESISTNASSATNISNYINNCENNIYYSYKSKSIINNKLKDINNSRKKTCYKEEEENKVKEIINKKININILNNNFDNSYTYISPEKTRYNYSNMKSDFKKKKINKLVHFNDNNFLKKKKIDSLQNLVSIIDYKNPNKENMSNIIKIDNISSPDIFRKPMKSYKKSDKITFSETSQKGRSKPNSNTSRGKCKNLINNTIKNNIINNKNIQNRKNINFNYDKLNELCHKMNFDLFNH